MSAEAEPLLGSQHFEIGREHHRVSVFDYLDAVAGPLDRRAVLAAAQAEQVLLNGEPVGPAVTLRSGDALAVLTPLAELTRDDTSKLVLLHRDEHLVVAAKPSGMAFDAGRSRTGRSALERLQDEHLEGSRPRAVHRLDKDTSGAVVAALDRETAERLTAQLNEGSARVEYLAVVRGTVREDGGQVHAPLGKRRRSDATVVVDERHGTPACTDWTVAERLRGFTVLTLRPHGGRSHQVRAHLASMGLPALCDRQYQEDDRLLLSQLKLGYRAKKGRPERPILARPALHAARLTWNELRVEAPLPNDLQVLLAQLRRLRPLDQDDPTESPISE